LRGDERRESRGKKKQKTRVPLRVDGTKTRGVVLLESHPRLNLTSRAGKRGAEKHLLDWWGDACDRSRAMRRASKKNVENGNIR